MKMIDQNVLDNLKKYYKVEPDENGFKLYAETEIGSADILFFKDDDGFHCGYKITNPNGEIIEEKGGTFEKTKAQRYFLRFCFNEVYSKLELGN